MSFIEYVASVQTSLLSILGVTLPYKEPIVEAYAAVNKMSCDADRVPEGEVWEINNLNFTSSVDQYHYLAVQYDATQAHIKTSFSGKMINWTGKILLEESQRIISRAAGLADLELDVLGVKRYAPEALKDLLHKVRPIPIEEDVQRARVRPDPEM